MMMNIERRRIVHIALLVVALTFEHHGKTRVQQVYGQAEGVSISSRSRGGGGEDFVKVSGMHFTRNGSTFYLNGFNAYWMMLVASDPTQRLKVASTLRQASTHGLTLARTWAFSDGTAASTKPLQSTPGSYNEDMFLGLDFVVSEAHTNGIYLIMSLVNYYSDFGGRKQYVQWARERGQNVTSVDDFYTNTMIKDFYKNHVKTILMRRNTIRGVIYKDDPTIFAWELINEPRCESDLSGNTLRDWIIEMATYVKSIDKKHLLNVGMEGFYGNSKPERKHLNPGGIVFGTDFLIHNQITSPHFMHTQIYGINRFLLIFIYTHLCVFIWYNYFNNFFIFFKLIFFNSSILNYNFLIRILF
ncbi:putative mannan endo-1,4-beta-mannosidase [Dioscorea sansibarensis]